MTYEELIKEKAREDHHYIHVIGWLRYEAIRKLGPHKYKELCDRNIKGGEHFDTMVDELVKKNHSITG